MIQEKIKIVLLWMLKQTYVSLAKGNEILDPLDNS